MKLEQVNGVYHSCFFINPKFAVDMGWFKQLSNGKYDLGPNLTIEIPKGLIPVPVDTAVGSTPSDEFWRMGTDPEMFRLQ